MDIKYALHKDITSLQQLNKLLFKRTHNSNINHEGNFSCLNREGAKEVGHNFHGMQVKWVDSGCGGILYREN